MSLIVRNSKTGITSGTTLENVFNKYHTNTLQRMIIMELAENDTYIEFDKVTIQYINGTDNIAKLIISELSTNGKTTLREYYDYVSKMFPDNDIVEYPDVIKFVLKKKWYRAFDKEHKEILPSKKIVPILRQIQACDGFVNARVQVHVRSFRTHNGTILFQPMIRKITLL